MISAELCLLIQIFARAQRSPDIVKFNFPLGRCENGLPVKFDSESRSNQELQNQKPE